jgi:outer membrane protein assembly factor BamB
VEGQQHSASGALQQLGATLEQHGTSGTLRWRYQTGASTADMGVQSSPALAPDGNTLYVGANDGVIYALSPDSGAVQWRFTTGGAIGYSSPVLSHDGGTLFVGSADHSLRAINTTSGKLLWAFVTTGAINSSPALSLSGGTVYIGRSASLLIL